MNDSVRDVLELFVAKAGELTNEEFTRFMQEFGNTLTYQYTANPQQIMVRTIAPTETMNKSFLLTYRMFVQGSEHMRFLDPTKEVSPDLVNPSLSVEWLNQIHMVSNAIHAYLLDAPTMPITINLVDPQGNVTSESLRRWDILETVLYGDYAHVSQRKRLQAWLSGPFGSMFQEFLMLEFREILMTTLHAIHYLADCARQEIEHTTAEQ